jgi:integrase
MCKNPLKTAGFLLPVLRALDGCQGYFVVKCALKLAPMFFVRPGELRHAEWSEIDLDEAVEISRLIK